MAKGRPRKPTALKALQGHPGQHPNRLNPDEPIPVGPLPEPPDGLTKAELDAWRTITGCIAPGVATISDLPMMVMTAKLYARLSDNTITDSQLATLLRCLGQLGMTPADRSRIVARHVERNSRFDRFK